MRIQDFIILVFLCCLALADNTNTTTPTFLPELYVCQSSDTTTEHILYGCAVALIIIGIAMVLYGYKTIKGIAFAVGFCVIFVIAFIVIDRYISLPSLILWYRIGISAALGVIAGGLLAYFVEQLSFIVGFLIGLLVTSLIFSTPIGPQSFTTGNWLPLVALLLGGIAGGVIGHFLSEWIMMFVSAALGSFLIAYAVDCAWFKSSFTTVLPNIIALHQFNLSGNLVPYLLIGGVVLLTLVGCIFQVYMFKRDTNQKGYRKLEQNELERKVN